MTEPRAGPKNTGERGARKLRFVCLEAARKTNWEMGEGGIPRGRKRQGAKPRDSRCPAPLRHQGHGPESCGSPRRAALASGLDFPGGGGRFCRGLRPALQSPSARGRQHSRAPPGAPSPPLSAAAGAGRRRTPGTMRGSRRPAPSWPGRSSRSKRGESRAGRAVSWAEAHSAAKSPGSDLFFF